MIIGTVTQDLEPVIQVEVVGPGQARQTVQAVVDTGFNGFITLPSSQISVLNLPWYGSRNAELADGSQVLLGLYRANVNWLGQLHPALVVAAEGNVIIGMSLLKGQRLTIDVVAGGQVSLEPLP